MWREAAAAIRVELAYMTRAGFVRRRPRAEVVCVAGGRTGWHAWPGQSNEEARVAGGHRWKRSWARLGAT